jgi:hypothetical protein
LLIALKDDKRNKRHKIYQLEYFVHVTCFDAYHNIQDKRNPCFPDIC